MVSPAYPDSVLPADSKADQVVAVVDGLIVFNQTTGKLYRVQGTDLGEIKTSDSGAASVSSDLLRYQRAIAYGIAQLCSMSLEDLLAAGDEA